LKALHLRANRTFVDVFGKKRKAGEEWLITLADSETHIPDVCEEIVGEVKITTLNNRQYCVVRDPWENGKQKFGKRQLRKGEVSFFLQPGESLENGIQNVHVLGEEEALLLKSREAYVDESKTERAPGDLWMIYGPCDYVPPVQVEIVEKRQSIPLDENEGIYVRDLKTGRVRAVHGESYMLKPNEELWAKTLPSGVEDLIYKTSREQQGPKDTPKRDPTRVVTYRAPHNWVVQIYDYKQKKARVVYGPDLVLLGPDEHFTVLSLSGGKPKTANQIKSIALFLGPDFMTDLVTVETSDHARLSLQLAYNWHFKPDDKDPHRIFQVPDFVGDACKSILPVFVVLLLAFLLMTSIVTLLISSREQFLAWIVRPDSPRRSYLLKQTICSLPILIFKASSQLIREHETHFKNLFNSLLKLRQNLRKQPLDTRLKDLNKKPEED
jgi:major vault protein